MAKPGQAQDSETTEVKNVQIFCNGNKFAPPKHVVVNTRQIRNFGTFLDELTRILNPLQGAIRRLYTPESGNPVEDTKELREGKGYVAAGKERFKKLNYLQIQPISPRRSKGPKFPYFDVQLGCVIKPVTHSQFRVSGKVKKINIKCKKIVVFPNGQFFLPPSIIVLNEMEQSSMDTVMHSVGIKVDLPQGGFPERLYTLDGVRIDQTDSVTNGTMYVAASHREKFKPGPYGPYMRMGQLKSRNPRPAVKDSESDMFHARQSRRKKSPEKVPVRQADYDRDQGGVFRAKEKNPDTQHATVVADTHHTNVDLPVDRTTAEQINEEELSGRGKEFGKNNEPSANHQKSKDIVTPASNTKNSSISSSSISNNKSADNDRPAKDPVSRQGALDGTISQKPGTPKPSTTTTTTTKTSTTTTSSSNSSVVGGGVGVGGGSGGKAVSGGGGVGSGVESKKAVVAEKSEKPLVDTNIANTPPADLVFSQHQQQESKTNPKGNDGRSSEDSLKTSLNLDSNRNTPSPDVGASNVGLKEKEKSLGETTTAAAVPNKSETKNDSTKAEPNPTGMNAAEKTSGIPPAAPAAASSIDASDRSLTNSPNNSREKDMDKDKEKDKVPAKEVETPAEKSVKKSETPDRPSSGQEKPKSPTVSDYPLESSVDLERSLQSPALTPQPSLSESFVGSSGKDDDKKNGNGVGNTELPTGRNDDHRNSTDSLKPSENQSKSAPSEVKTNTPPTVTASNNASG